MNSKYLVEVKDQIKVVWNSCDPSLGFFKKLKEITRLYKDYYKHKAKEFCKEERKLKLELEMAMRNLKCNLKDLAIQTKVSQLQV
jgi:hypothetical protein